MLSGSRLGGLVVRVAGSLRFVPASVAIEVVPPPRLTAVAGAPRDLLGIALFSGVVIPVLAVGDARVEMIVCQCEGELVGVLGARVVDGGTFETVGDHAGSPAVAYRDEIAMLLDVPALSAGVQAAALARSRTG
jgi:chemotaxis signal transduction protein